MRQCDSEPLGLQQVSELLKLRHVWRRFDQQVCPALSIAGEHKLLIGCVERPDERNLGALDNLQLNPFLLQLVAQHPAPVVEARAL